MTETYKGRGGKRKGAGRPPGSGKNLAKTSQVVRVPMELPPSEYQNLPSLMAAIRYWKDEVAAAKERGESLRTYEKLMKLLSEIEELGY